MTLIAFACYGDRAEFVTDSVWYTRRLDHLGHTSKHIALPHLSAAVLTQGDSLFGDHAKSAAMQASDHRATFDDLVTEMPQHFAKCWADLLKEDSDRSTPVVFMLGWSGNEDEFVAYMYAAEQQFKPIRLKKPYAIPMSYKHRPSAMEMRRLRPKFSDTPAHVSALDVWETKPPLAAPDSLEQWIALAEDCRLHRSRGGGWANTIVAGDLFHTTLTRDQTTTRRIHSFNDSGDEFYEIIEHSQHPIALAAECWCGSAKTFGACHGRKCHCDDSKIWAVCHGEAQTVEDSQRVRQARAGQAR